MKIGIIGAGRLGLTFALLCEKNGYDVIVSDVREDYVFNLNQKICLTNEPLIQSMLLEVKNFSATTNNIDIIQNSDMIFTFVATPSTLNGNYDTTKVFEVRIETDSEVLEGGKKVPLVYQIVARNASGKLLPMRMNIRTNK